MKKLRLRALELFEKLSTPKWIISLEKVYLEKIA